MTATERLTRFIDRLRGRGLPLNPRARSRVLARELAEGATEGVWSASISHFRGSVNLKEVIIYFLARWQEMKTEDAFQQWEKLELEGLSQMIWNGKNLVPGLDVLVNSGYLRFGNNAYDITRDAFDLVEETEPANIFISYNRGESSAFALLVLARLKAEGLEPFLDLALPAGSNWQQELDERIQKYQYFVVLIGKKTLESQFVQQEIRLAIQHEQIIIPVLHNAMEMKGEGWESCPADLAEALRERQAIRVIQETPTAYNNAIIELLNRFGVTP
jgi:hypothetical protein